MGGLKLGRIAPSGKDAQVVQKSRLESTPMDCNITECIVILDKNWENDLPAATEMLKGAGMRITNADDDNSVVEGEIDSEKLHALEKLPCVDYVRKVFSYDANFPPGDPRDRDGM